MLVFWRKNEKEERDLRKKAEKEAIDRAKREEELREARRQARKLNFLITQTELYSHFVGKKVGVDDEGIDDTDPSPIPSGSADAPSRFEELDFDVDDDEALRAAAARSAQNAVQLAQNKAKDFDAATRNDAKPATDIDMKDIDIDAEDLNFTNPTGLSELEQIPQPKMLHCQLKEYQLKGLNWLVNLYEQGINGILADEMGLGKTVQSISVMAYLAENHNVWGPFLVIAPASTLHNWQQELTRFVPGLKALPYWGNAKDRKVLRKFWNRKHVTYTQDAPFHVLITSYQLVVQDEKYFQKIKWQYMILDEAQAIKSSSSSRWKILLGLHCRNRLLLTGTPIQNTMQGITHDFSANNRTMGIVAFYHADFV
jgi:DNA helicase INO80